MQEAALYQGWQTMAQPHPCVLSVALSGYNGRGQEYGRKASHCCHLALYRKSLPDPALGFNQPELKSRSCPFYPGEPGQAPFISKPHVLSRQQAVAQDKIFPFLERIIRKLRFLFCFFVSLSFSFFFPQILAD